MAFHQSNGGGGAGNNSLRGMATEYSGDEHETRSGGGEERPDSDLHDKPTYLLEHLATFTVNKETGIVYPADGMRRLLQLEKTTGIWSQKMQLCLDYQWVLIMDFETGKIIERFPATLIQEPTAFTSTDAMELYNNILVFIVSGGNGVRSEMHIFQSQSVSAVHLVEDLKNLRNGKIVTQQRETLHQTQQQMNTSNNVTTMRHRSEHHHHHHHSQHQQHAQRSSNIDQYGIRGGTSELGHGHGLSSAGNAETDSEQGGLNDETSSTSSDKYERDVTVLNHCFDDIEKFIARLQHAAAATRELERRRRNRKSKKKDPGEGLLTLRTRPPHEKEFIDIFAKFKLSFNLLAKLKAHIHDPNAPELVHFLFTPLALIVEASSDTYYESQLPARVINPLLTREAINLLINCVTSKETELWRSLGDAWIIPRDQWKEDVGSYHPVFLDGWSPDYLVVDELESPTTPTNINTKHRLESQAAHYSDLNGRGGAGITGTAYDDYEAGNGGINLTEKFSISHGHNDRERERDRDDRAATGIASDFNTHNDISIDTIDHDRSRLPGHISSNDGIEGNSGPQNIVSLQAITTGIQNLHAREQKNLSTRGAYGGGGPVNDSQTDMHFGANAGSTGADQFLEAWLDELQATGAKIVLVTYPRTANNDKELSVVRGEYLEILDDTRKWWKARNIRGQVAHVPHTIVTPYNYGDAEPSNQFYTQQQHQQQQNSHKARHSANVNAGDNNDQRVSDTTEWIRNKHLGTIGAHSRDDSIYACIGLEHTISVIPVPPPLPVYSVSETTYARVLKPTTMTYDSISASPQAPASLSRDNDLKHSTKSSKSPPLNEQTASTNGAMQMQDELKHVLRMRERRGDLNIHKTPTIYIDQSSSSQDVAAWLHAKEFSDTIAQNLANFTGDDLFKLQTAQLEELFGVKEGRRLASQIKLQKSVSGYKTARSKELQAILARARPKSEDP